jgi:phosphatidylserine/phosphatidylglycerophosphate/cardiolipin synthase-like enzyme
MFSVVSVSKNLVQRFAEIRLPAIAFFLPFLLLQLPVAQAEQYPPIDNKNTEIIILPNSSIDKALRLSRLRSAHHSIQSITYLQGFDSFFGAPFVKASRTAMDNGAKGEFIFDRVSSWIFDGFSQKGIKYLNHPNATVVPIGPISKIVSKLKLSNIFHEKVLIIDAGTPDEIIFVGGRNNNGSLENWMDFAMAIRPLDSSRPYLGTQIKAAYAKASAEAKKIQKPEAVNFGAASASSRALSSVSDQPTEGLTASEVSEYNRLNQLVTRPASPEDIVHSDVFIPSEVHLGTNELISRVRKGIAPEDVGKSDIIDDVVKDLPDSKELTLFSFNTKFAPDLAAGLETAMSNGATVRIFTGPRKTRGLSPKNYGYLNRFIYNENVVELRKLDQIASQHHGRLEVFSLKPSEKYVFMHRKMATSKKSDGTSRVATGSDNFNLESATRSDEIMISVNDERMYEAMTRLTAEEAVQHFERVTSEQLEKDYRSRGPLECVVSFVRGFY